MGNSEGIMEKGIIVSIQKYTQATTQELAIEAIKGGAVAIRTDQPLNIDIPIIGLEKLHDKEYYITTEVSSIIQVMKWSDYIAIDLRQGNKDIEILLAHCHVNNLKVIADIYTIKDIDNIMNICQMTKIKLPEYFSTTFQYEWSFEKKLNSIKEIKNKYPNINLIAEGGYKNSDKLLKINELCSNICIGNAISGIRDLTIKHKSSWEGVLCC